MSQWVAIPTFMVIAASIDYLVVQWHEARERREPGKSAAWAMMYEAVSWLPLWFAIHESNVLIAAAAVMGSGVGTFIAVRRKRDEPIGAP